MQDGIVSIILLMLFPVQIVFWTFILSMGPLLSIRIGSLQDKSCGEIATLPENLIRINQTLIEKFQADIDFLFSTGP